MKKKITCEYQDWDDTCYPKPVCHCLKRENVDCANGDDIEKCPDFKRLKIRKL